MNIVILVLNSLFDTKTIILLDRYIFILPQMSEYIKYFENGGKNMSFMIEDDSVLQKYNEIWNKIKNTLNIEFHSVSI